jgi:hypothetical protein
LIPSSGVGAHPADNASKRLISAKRYAPGSWTILYARDPEGAYGGWFSGATWNEISNACAGNKKRVIFLERYGGSDKYTAVLLNNM